ncbi:MAG: tetratricopeptide repeat protein [Methanophagales archaeon]|nr:tetratricopeptide repeat protein [Methanophagales archaeon]
MNSMVKEHIERGEIEKALKLASEQDIEYLYEVGEGLVPSEPIKAARIFRRILKLEPENDRTHEALGHSLYNLGKWDEAEREFEEAIMIKPDDAEYRCYLANLLVELERYEDAEKEFEEALRLKPDDYWTHNDFGVLLHKWERYDEAEREFKDALGLNPVKPKEAGIRINLGALFEEWGHYNEAKSEYEKAIAILRELVVRKPGDAEVVRYLARAHYNLGSLLADKLKSFDEAKGEFKEAIRIFEEAKKREPEFAEELAEELATTHNNLGASLCESGKYKEAKKEFEEAIRFNKKIKKEDPLVYINLGNVYGKLNCIDLAIENFKNAIEANPSFADAHQNLIRAELIKKGVGLSWWDWWQTSLPKKVVGLFLGGAAIILSGVTVCLVFKGETTPAGLLVLIAIAVFLLLFPEIQYFKAGPFEFSKEPRYFSPQPKSFYVLMPIT